MDIDQPTQTINKSLKLAKNVGAAKAKRNAALNQVYLLIYGFEWYMNINLDLETRFEFNG